MDTTSNGHILKLPAKPKTALKPNDRARLLAMLESTEMNLENQDGFFRGALYSGPGGGKTTFGARLGDQEKRTIIFDAENSTEVIKQSPDLLSRYRKGLIKAYPFPGLREITELLPAYEADPTVDTVMIDSFTAATAFEERDILREVPFTRGSAAPGEEKVLKDFGLVLDRWTWLLDVALATRLNFILICHERPPTEDEIKAGFTMRTVAGTMNQSKVVMSRLSNVLYLTASWDTEGKRTGYVYTRPITGQRLKGFPDTYAKNRLGLKPKMTDIEAMEAIAKTRYAVLPAE